MRLVLPWKLIPGILVLFCVLFLLSGNSRVTASADSPLSVATSISVSGNVPEGSIVSFSQGGYKLSTIPYDPAMYGVVTLDPAIAFSTDASTISGQYVITNGQAKVRVSTANGVIHMGDSLTSSANSGVGQKADKVGGYVLGIAMEDYTVPDKNAVGLITASINIHPDLAPNILKTNLLEGLKLGIAAPFLAPTVSLRYILAVLAVLAAFSLGFVFFGRTASRGIEALGRNPLASPAIALSMVFNVILTAVVIFVGLGLAYFILIL